MKMTAGLWIDHRRAVIVMISPRGEETMEILSNIEKQPGRIEGTRSTAPYEAQRVQADNSRERKFTGQLDQYYTEVMAALRGVESLFIFGPGEAKGELKNHLEHARLGANISAVETSDKMTDNQIVAKVRDYFNK
jgi:hypothetical protein